MLRVCHQRLFSVSPYELPPPLKLSYFRQTFLKKISFFLLAPHFPPEHIIAYWKTVRRANNEHVDAKNLRSARKAGVNRHPVGSNHQPELLE